MMYQNSEKNLRPEMPRRTPVPNRFLDTAGMPVQQAKSGFIDNREPARVSQQKQNLFSEGIAPSSSVLQMAKITTAKPNGSLNRKARNNFVHFNLQMSGDARMAIAGVGLANKNEARNNVYNGLIVSVPKDTEKGVDTDQDFVDKKLYGLLSTHNVKDKTSVYATSDANVHNSRSEGLGDWSSKYQKADPGSRALNVFQTGKIHPYIDYYEKVQDATSLKDSLEADYSAGLPDDTEENKAFRENLDGKNKAGNVVFWFKGDPAESASINSVQTAKTEHWFSAAAGATVIDRLGRDYAVAGGLTGNQEGILGNRLKTANDYRSDKLKDKGYDKMGKQYGFFAAHSHKMTHFGGRSGHLEPLGAMGIKTVYFEEKGNSQAGRNVKIGKDSALEKVVITGLTGIPGLVSKALSWIKSDGSWRENGASLDQKAYVDTFVNKWLGLLPNNVVKTSNRKHFYNRFLKGQDKNKSLSENTEKVQDKLEQHHDLGTLESQVLMPTDVSRIVEATTGTKLSTINQYLNENGTWKTESEVSKTNINALIKKWMKAEDEPNQQVRAQFYAKYLKDL